MKETALNNETKARMRSVLDDAAKDVKRTIEWVRNANERCHHRSLLTPMHCVLLTHSHPVSEKKAQRR